jgi:hypothetical protein
MSISRTSALVAYERARTNGWTNAGVAAEVGVSRDKLTRFLRGIGVEDEQRLVLALCMFGRRLAAEARPLIAESNRINLPD